MEENMEENKEKENEKKPPLALTILPSPTPGVAEHKTEDEFPRVQPPVVPMTNYVYLQAPLKTKSTIYGMLPTGMAVSEYFFVPKGAKRSNNIDHKTAIANTLCLGNTARIHNMQLLYMLQVIRREESLIIWDDHGLYANTIGPILDEHEYQTLDVSLPVESQETLCNTLRTHTPKIERLEELINVAQLNEMLQSVRNTHQKTAIFINVEKTDLDPIAKDLYYLFMMHIYIYVMNVARTEPDRYFYWPVHIVIPEIAIFDENRFPFRQLELARYRGFLSFIGTARCPNNLTALQYRPVIKTAFVNNLLVLESNIHDQLSEVIKRDLGVTIAPPSTNPKQHIVQVLVEKQIRAKMDPFVVQELKYDDHPLIAP